MSTLLYNIRKMLLTWTWSQVLYPAQVTLMNTVPFMFFTSRRCWPIGNHCHYIITFQCTNILHLLLHIGFNMKVASANVKTASGTYFPVPYHTSPCYYLIMQQVFILHRLCSLPILLCPSNDLWCHTFLMALVIFFPLFPITHQEKYIEMWDILRR